jgi:hypothetical protein
VVADRQASADFLPLGVGHVKNDRPLRASANLIVTVASLPSAIFSPEKSLRRKANFAATPEV